MSDDDDIARLLREIDAMNAATGEPSKSPATQPSSPAPSKDVVPADSGGGRGKWALIAALGSGVAGFIVGTLLWFLPFVNSMDTAVGAALGGAIVALISGPPNWMK